MKKINKIQGSKILMCGYIIISVAASCQYSSSVTATNSYPHLVYGHVHIDHIGGTKTPHLDNNTIIIAHDETKRLLARASDPNHLKTL